MDLIKKLQMRTTSLNIFIVLGTVRRPWETFFYFVFLIKTSERSMEKYFVDRNQNVLLNTSESTNYQTTFRIRRKENDAMLM